MPQLIGQGGTITLDATYQDINGDAHDATTPQVSILDPNGDTVVAIATPTRVGLGHYTYEYAVAVDALQGAWSAKWYGLINGVQVGPVEDGFTVAAAGAIVPGGNAGATTCSPWATHEDVVDGPCATYSTDPDELDEALQIASDMLYALTRRRYKGICTDTVRPNAEWREWKLPRWWPVSGDAWWGYCSCHRGRENGCVPVHELKLPGQPVNPNPAALTIMLDGNQLDPSSYRIDDHGYLVRTDGLGWPCCQRMELDDTEEGTFSITYPFGRMPPVGGVRACKVLGCQLLLGWSDDEDDNAACMLPERVTTITRQGVTMALIDPLTLFDDGKTGVPFVDLWVSTVNRSSNQRSATAIIPGRHRSVRRAGQ